MLSLSALRAILSRLALYAAVVFFSLGARADAEAPQANSTQANSTQANPTPSAVVKVATGRLQGEVLPTGVTRFLGVPYAASTAGSNRWRAPQPPNAWRGIRVADQFGANCYQLPPPTHGPWTEDFFSRLPMSEDCLFLNIWTPQNMAAQAPVLVWIHGGAFIGGSGAVPVYDGARLAEHGIVVVTINYRLGIFGFLNHPLLQAEGAAGGQFGLLDQMAALRWVQHHIQQFGGDPQRVTVAGQSAGAASVQALLLNPMSEGLFSQAILQSGAGMGVDLPSPQRSQQLGEQVFDVLSVASLQASRALPAEQVLQASMSPQLPGPVPAMGFRPLNSAEAMQLSEPISIPILTGITGNENAYKHEYWAQLQKDDALAKLFQLNLGEQGDAARALYLKTYATPGEATRQMLLDRGLAASSAWSKQHADTDAVYTYLFDKSTSGELQEFGSFHSAEIPYVFGNLAEDAEQADWLASAVIMGAWLEFIKTGKPGLRAECEICQPWQPLSSGNIYTFGENNVFGPRATLGEKSVQKQVLFDRAVLGGTQLGLFSARPH